MIVSLGIPGFALSPLCPAAGGISATSLATFCLAYSTCNGLPTAAIVSNGPMIACFAGQTAITAASAGVNQILSGALALGVGSFGLGFSPTNSLQMSLNVWDITNTKDFDTVWTNGGNQQITVNGMFYSYVSIGSGALQKILKFPGASLLGVGGGMKALTSFGSIISPDLQNLLLSKPGAHLSSDSAVFPEFVTCGVISGGLGLGLREWSGGGLPAFEGAGLFTFTTLITTMDPIKNNGLARGVYLNFVSGDALLLQLARSLVNFICETTGNVFNFILPKSHKMLDLKKALDAKMPSSNWQVSLALTASKFGIYIQIPLGAGILPLTDKIVFNCTIDILAANKFTCGITLKDPMIVNFAKTGGLWVAREARAGGKVLAAVAEKYFKKAGNWTKDAIQTTGQAIKDGLITAEKDIKVYSKAYILRV
jgi:hypothetical protein